MDAPTYPPAARFEPPVHRAYDKLSLEIVSLADLMSAPAAWAIVVKHAPFFEFMVKTAQVKPYLSNFTYETFANLGLVTRAEVDAINQDLATLPPSQWPVL